MTLPKISLRPLALLLVLGVFIVLITVAVSKKGLFSLKPKADTSITTAIISELNRSVALPQNYGQATSTQATLDSNKPQIYGRTIIPSVLGTISTYTGASSYDYAFQLPKARGGFSPSLGLSYSSQTIDDARLGNKNWKTDYSVPPSIAGMGFSLQGMGEIVRDIRNNKEWFGDDRFIVNFPGGSFELIWNGNRWVSLPNGFIKVERGYHAPSDQEGGDIGANNGGRFKIIDGAAWSITTKDGTTYEFGDTNLYAPGTFDGGGTPVRPIANLLDATEKCTSPDCTQKEQKDGAPCPDRVFLTTKWLLRKITDPNGQQVYYSYNPQTKSVANLFPSSCNTGNPGNVNIGVSIPVAYVDTIEWGQTQTNIQSTSRFRVLVNNVQDNPQGLEDRQTKDTAADTGPFNEVTKRVHTIVVQVKNPQNSWQTAKKYVLTYCKDGDLASGGACVATDTPIPTLPRQDAYPSLLKSITEYGTGSEYLPAVSFKYTPLDIGSVNANSVYLTEIHNGYGATTTFTYSKENGQPFFNVAYRSIGNVTDTTGSGGWGSQRVRVGTKTVTDTVGNKSYREEYAYSGSMGYAEYIADESRQIPGSGYQFLGHGAVSIKKYDFNNTTLLSHQKAEFYQANQSVNCFEPHPAKGLPKETIVYRSDDDSDIAASTETTYGFTINGGEKSNINTCVNPLVPGATTDPNNPAHIRQPIFVHAVATIQKQFEASDATYLSRFLSLKGQNSGLSTINDLKSTQITASKNISYDTNGNLTKSVMLADVSKDCSGSEKVHSDVDNEDLSDCKEADNRYSYTYFFDALDSWRLNLPYLSYAATSGTCTGTSAGCQYQRTEDYYNDRNQLADVLGLNQSRNPFLLTRSVTFKDIYNPTGDNKRFVQLFEYDRSHAPNLLRTFGPKPGVESVTSSGEDVTQSTTQLVKTAETEYDLTYFIFPTKTTNAKGHQTLIPSNDYDYVLGLPKTIRTQIDATHFQRQELVYDSFGRITETKSDNPQTEAEDVLPKPVSITQYFDNAAGNNGGMVVRTLSLASKIGDAYYYTTADSFYDGLGQVRQSQILKTAVSENDVPIPKRLVSWQVVNADGRVVATKETQTADPIDNSAPTFLDLLANTLSSTSYDTLGRTVSTSNTINGNQTNITTYAYLANAQKTTDPLGISKVVVTDAYGRTLWDAVTNNSQKQVVSQHIYDQSLPFVDKPTTLVMFLSDGVPASLKVAQNRYDQSGLLLSAFDPSLGRSEFTYDILGNTLTQNRYPGETSGSLTGKISFEYDVLGRIIHKTFDKSPYPDAPYPSGTSDLAKRQITYTYDEGTYHNGEAAAYAYGKLVGVTEPTGYTDVVYDAGQRVKKTTKNIFGKTKDFTTSFNELSQVQNTTSDGEAATFAYDEYNHVKTMSFNNQEVLNQNLFNKNGKRVLSTIPFAGSNYKSRNSYDALGRLQALSFWNADDAARDPLLQLFQYESANSLINTTLEKTAASQARYTFYHNFYDGFGQLTDVKSTETNPDDTTLAHYEYDLLGRITKKNELSNSVALNYDDTKPIFAPKSLVLGAQTSNLTYDPNTGGLASDQNGTYTYNQFGQLISMQTGNGGINPSPNPTGKPTPTPTPTTPVPGISLLGEIQTSSIPHTVAVLGDYAYVLSNTSAQEDSTYGSVVHLDVYNIHTPATIAKVTSLPLGTGVLGKMVLSGNFLYVTTLHLIPRIEEAVIPTPRLTDHNTLQVIDVTNPASPGVKYVTSIGDGIYTTEGRYMSDTTHAQSLFVSGRYIYLAEQTRTPLRVFDIQDPISPSSPTQVGSLPVDGGLEPVDMVVSGGYAYLPLWGNPDAFSMFEGSNSGVEGKAIPVGHMAIVDTTNPTNPRLIRQVEVTGYFLSAISASGSYLFVASTTSNVPNVASQGKMDIFDISGVYQDNPRKLGSTSNSPSNGLVASYGLSSILASSGTIQKMTFTDPLHPTILSALPTKEGFIPKSLIIRNGLAYVLYGKGLSADAQGYLEVFQLWY